MKLSVVILNYNVRYFLQQCLYSVQRAVESLDAEIIVIDNNSKDDSCRMVKELFPTVRLLENKENVGFSKANNQAVAVAKGEYVCILNPDTVVAEDTFTRTLDFAQRHPEMGILGVHLIDGTGNFLPESKRNIPTPLISLKKVLGSGSSYYANHLSPEDTGEVAVLVGAFMILKRSLYNSVGGFDEDYFMYGEDIDFSYSIAQAGYKNYYLGDVKVLHYKGESTQKDLKYLDRFYGAMQIFYKKHFTQGFLIKQMVHTGVFLAKQRAKLFYKKPVSSPFKIEEGILVSENDSPITALEQIFNVPFKKQLQEDIQKPLVPSCMVFDASYLSYGAIIEKMVRLKSPQTIFRILSPDGTFVIGSDLSDAKGGVEML